jgi:hypothetical protein
MKLRRTCGAPLVLAAALMLPAAAHASRADVVGDTLSVQGGALQRNEIAVTLTRNESNGELFYLITELRDGGPRVLAGDQCTTGSSIPAQVVSDSFFGQIGQMIASNPLISELGNQLFNRAKTVGCISTGSGSFLELGGAQNIKKIVIDLKDSSDSATVDALFPPGFNPPPSLVVARVEMHGGAQDDLLSGGPNADVLLGEKGDVVIRSREGVPDQVLCGAGSDVAQVDLRDVVLPDCEIVQRLAIDATPGASIQRPRTLRDGRVRALLECPSVGPCQGTLSLRNAKGRVLDAKRYRLAAGAKRAVTLRGRRAAKLVASERDHKGRPKTFSVTL